MQKNKAFTLIELMIVIVLITFLISILLLSIRRPNHPAYRAMCGTHLSGLGKALLTYANDYDGQYPRAGGKGSIWGPTSDWDADSEQNVFGDPPGAGATIGSSLYLLIKYADAGTRIFTCGRDTDAIVFELADYPGNTVYRQDITEAWDFGGPTDTSTGIPAKHYSYSYHFPYTDESKGDYVLSPLSEAGFPLMADRNPYLAVSKKGLKPYHCSRYYGTPLTDKFGNSPNHKNEGQNVLFNDCHVSFEEKPFCGINDDNIYSIADTANIEEGTAPLCFDAPLYDPNKVKPAKKLDSVLINEGIKDGGIYIGTKYP